MDLIRDPRRRLVLVLSGVVLLALVGSLLALGAVRGLLPGTADCTVTIGERSVDLSTQEAEVAAQLSARAVRRQLPLGQTAAALTELVDLPDRDAPLVVSALTGRSRHALSCTHGGADEEERDRLDRSGLTARAARVRRDLDSTFGRQRVGGFAPGGVRSGHMPGSAHYEGRAVDVFFRPISPANKTRGWAIAQYLVAEAERLEIDTVIFDARIWTARRGGQGWRDYQPGTAGRTKQVAAILEHRDHVHVDVAD